ncbi:PDZ domain-containing protein [Cohnella cellulosilytica]|uniref:PDZ domain-containing protein n=1 Tax=Cohnella cellulosilytica TaxID=986710 RepID=A0ABW2FPE0_9BACL
MADLLDVLREAGQAAIGLFTFPYFYIAIALVWWHARHTVNLQRRLYHVRLYGTLRLTLTRVGAGLAAGAALSLAGLGAGAALNGETLMFVWIALGVLALFRFRYICLAYAAGALGLLQSAAEWTGFGVAEGTAAEALRILLAIDVPALLFIAGLLHIAEGLLVRLQNKTLAIPLFLQGKRGKAMGAYAVAGVWPVPLLWLVPSSDGGFSLPWAPLFGGDAAAWSLLAFPVLIGFGDRTSAYWAERKAKTSGNWLMLYGAIIAALAVCALYWPPLVAIASAAAFLLHEGLLWIGRLAEAGKAPLYSQDGTGVKVLAVLPGTPAEELGLQAGEVIKKVNGTFVRNKEELHAALQLQSAYCKLEVVNREGHVKFLQRARYEGEHYQLGVIPAPDDVEFVASPRSASIWQGLKGAGARRLRNSPTMRYEEARREAELAAAEQAAAAQAAAEEAARAERERAEQEAGLPPRAQARMKS